MQNIKEHLQWRHDGAHAERGAALSIRVDRTGQSSHPHEHSLIQLREAIEIKAYKVKKMNTDQYNNTSLLQAAVRRQ